MIGFLGYLFVSVLLSFGFAIALVEKGDEYPIKKLRDFLKKILEKYISKEFSEVLNCSTCTSFWTSLLSDLILMVISIVFFGTFYFFWPLSGFITMGITWFIIELLNAIDK